MFLSFLLYDGHNRRIHSRRGCTESQSRRHCERSEAIQNTVNHWIASGCTLTMTLFVSGILRGFSGLLHFVRNDGQRWLASIYDDALCYVLAKELSENKHYIFHYYIVQNFLKAS
jgi:hypothetical protein